VTGAMAEPEVVLARRWWVFTQLLRVYEPGMRLLNTSWPADPAAGIAACATPVTGEEARQLQVEHGAMASLMALADEHPGDRMDLSPTAMASLLNAAEQIFQIQQTAIDRAMAKPAPAAFEIGCAKQLRRLTLGEIILARGRDDLRG
jgi:hypothetical protein